MKRVRPSSSEISGANQSNFVCSYAQLQKKLKSVRGEDVGFERNKEIMKSSEFGLDNLRDLCDRLGRVIPVDQGSSEQTELLKLLEEKESFVHTSGDSTTDRFVRFGVLVRSNEIAGVCDGEGREISVGAEDLACFRRLVFGSVDRTMVVAVGGPPPPQSSTESVVYCPLNLRANRDRGDDVDFETGDLSDCQFNEAQEICLVRYGRNTHRLIDRRSCGGPYGFDECGRPVNGFAKTGFTGLGSLWRFGPNHLSIFVIARSTDSVREVIVRRCESGGGGKLRLPEVRDEIFDGNGRLPDRLICDICRGVAIGEDSDERIRVLSFLRNRPKLIGSGGYLHDSRNTDNAWIEARAYGFEGRSLDCPLWSVCFDQVGSSGLSWISVDEPAIADSSRRLLDEFAVSERVRQQPQ